jgi:hypothetical protein
MIISTAANFATPGQEFSASGVRPFSAPQTTFTPGNESSRVQISELGRALAATAAQIAPAATAGPARVAPAPLTPDGTGIPSAATDGVSALTASTVPALASPAVATLPADSRAPDTAAPNAANHTLEPHIAAAIAAYRWGNGVFDIAVDDTYQAPPDFAVDITPVSKVEGSSADRDHPGTQRNDSRENLKSAAYSLAI